jgi:hypothetical protein
MGDGSSTSRSVVEVSTRQGLHGPSRDFMALGDADGGVRLLQLDMDDAEVSFRLEGDSEQEWYRIFQLAASGCSIYNCAEPSAVLGPGRTR